MSEQNTAGRDPVNKTRMTYLEFLDGSPMTKYLWLLVCGMSLAQMLDGMDFMSTSFALPGLIREFHLNPAQAGGIPSMSNLGLMLGTIFITALCDRIGRKVMFQWVVLIYCFGTLISALAPNMYVLLTGRFLAGCGLGAEWPIVFVILAEFSPTKLRHKFIPLGSIFFSAGWFIAALFSLLLIPHFGWRAIYWVGVLPALMVVYLRFGMPESPRLLLAKGKVQEAGVVIHDLARRAGRENIDLVPPPMEKGQGVLSYGRQFSALRVVWAPVLVLTLVSFCQKFQTFGMNAWLPTVFMRQGFRLTTSFWFTLIIMSVTPFGQIFATWLQNALKRNWALFVLATGGTIFFLIFGMSFQYKWPVVVMVGSQTLEMLFSQAVVPIVATLATEVTPTPARTLSMAFVYGIGALGGALGPLLLGFALKAGMGISEIIYLFALPIFVVALALLFVIRVDSRRRSLESISQEYRQRMDKATPAQAGR